MDLSGFTFNPNQKREAAARDAATGVRLLLLAIPASVMAMIATLILHDTALSLLAGGITLTSFALGAYGAYLVASALDWAGFINLFVVLSVFVPYLKFLVFIVLIAFGVRAVNEAGFRFSLFGALRRHETA
jgi:hypothetical protein